MKQTKIALATINLATTLAIIAAFPAYAGFGNLFGGGSGSSSSGSSGGDTTNGAGMGNLLNPFTPPGAIGAIDGDDGSARETTKKPGSSGKSSTGGTGNAPPGDYTDDEHRMQGRYQSDLQHARRTIALGEKMMKSAGDNVNSKTYKKGKVLKEIGEKDLKRLQENTPFPAQSTLDEKPNRKKPDSL